MPIIIISIVLISIFIFLPHSFDFAHNTIDFIENILIAIHNLNKNGLHKYYLTHSILNPIVIITILIFLILIYISKRVKVFTPLAIFWGYVTIGATLILMCHLLVDILPKDWIS